MATDPFGEFPAHVDRYADALVSFADALVKRGVPEHQARALAVDLVVQLLIYRVETREPWDHA